MQRLLNIFPSSVTPHPFLPESHRVIMLQTNIPQEQKGFLDPGHWKSYPRAIFRIKILNKRLWNPPELVHTGLYLDRLCSSSEGLLSYAHYITAIVWPAFEQGKRHWRLQPFPEGAPELAQKLIPPSSRWIRELGWASRGDQRWQGSFSLRSQLEKWTSAHGSSPFLPKSLGRFLSCQQDSDKYGPRGLSMHKKRPSEMSPSHYPLNQTDSPFWIAFTTL